MSEVSLYIHAWYCCESASLSDNIFKLDATINLILTTGSWQNEINLLCKPYLCNNFFEQLFMNYTNRRTDITLWVDLWDYL